MFTIQFSIKMGIQVITTIMLLIIASISYSQDEFTIDFEQIPNATPFEGLSIGDQFLDVYGISFALEDGSVPVLAEVGNPVTAFQSSYGGDTPAPGENIGDYFLTDDGVFTGLESPPLLITSVNPIQKIGGEILDVDLDEFFIIEAMDINGVIIQSDTITAGDPDTGDGIGANWELEINQCEGIYSVRLNGEREAAGIFGLGIDNLFFQLLKPNPEQSISIETDASDCMMNNGSISLESNSSSSLTYSIDGTNFQSTPFFQNLASGNYTVYVQNDLGCIGTLETEVNSNDFLELNISEDICEDETYDFFGDTLDSTGIYTAILPAENGCDTMVTLELNQWASQVTTITHEGCEGDGFSVNIGGTIYDEGNPVGQEILTAQSGCDSVVNIDLSFSSSITFTFPQDTLVVSGSNVNIQPPSLAFEPDSLLWFTNTTDDYCTDCPNLDIIPETSGQVSLTIVNTNGCHSTSSFTLVLEPLQIYIPNSFSPNGDGINDRFEVYTNYQELSISRFEIYDRWGGQLFSYYGSGNDSWQASWDGRYDGSDLNTGIYVYLIEVETASGRRKQFSGEVSLVR
jgi:gliding motility-associated-like protein